MHAAVNSATVPLGSTMNNQGCLKLVAMRRPTPSGPVLVDDGLVIGGSYKSAGNYPWKGTTTEKQKKYAKFVEEGLLKESDDYSQHIKAQVILGSDSFTEKIKRKYLDLKKGLKDCPQGKRLSSFSDIEEVARIRHLIIRYRKKLFLSDRVKITERDRL